MPALREQAVSFPVFVFGIYDRNIRIYDGKKRTGRVASSLCFIIFNSHWVASCARTPIPIHVPLLDFRNGKTSQKCRKGLEVP
eukprot:636280-Pyramimonas_sp.AAC.1